MKIKKVKKRIRSRRLMSALLCLSMVTTMLSGFGIATAAKSERDVSDGITRDASRQADPSTMDTYQKVLNFEESTRYAGRLWSDKSVFAYDKEDAGDRSGSWSGTTLNLDKDKDGVPDGVSDDKKKVELDADFMHVYSVLGSSVQVNEPTPADLVLALDISGSMNSPTANEGAGWINTVDPTDAATFSQGLGFYKGSTDNGIGTGVVTTDQGGYQGYENDDNGIPDAIVPVLPANSYTEKSEGGQMEADRVDGYNSYLAFCNVLVNVLLEKDTDNNKTISDAEAAAIRNELKIRTTYVTDAKIDGITVGEFQKLYTAYDTYKTKFDGTPTSRDPWMSDNTSSSGNAIWPDNGENGWDEAVKAFCAVPVNPLENAGNAPNRMYYVLEAANSFIDQYLSLNEKNRISVVVYDSVATVLMPLAHYEKAKDNDGKEKNYLSAEKHHWQSWSVGQWASTVTATAVPKSGYENNTFDNRLLKNGVYSASVTSWSNTGTAIAINAALDILANSSDNYGDLKNRMPMMVLMTDGAANIAMTGLADNDTSLTTAGEKIFDKAWTRGSRQSTTGATAGVKGTAGGFNGYDGMVFKDGRTYNLLNGTDAFANQTSSGLTVYGANYGHIYGDEGDADIRYTVVLNTLMSTAYQKALVEKHYNGGSDYPVNDEDDQEWTEANIYTIGFGLNYYDNSTQGICEEILNPKDNFNADHSAKMPTDDAKEIGFKNAFDNMLDGYTKWQGGTDYTQSFSKNGTTSGITGETMPDLTLKFPIKQDDLNGTGVTKADIDRNIAYNTEYYSAVLEGAGNSNDKTLGDVFEAILSLIENEMFTPVGGSNDLGVENSVTYMDPMGKYMEVKDVKKMLLFGELHDVVKTAVYDYSFNNEYMKDINQQYGKFVDGWYKRNGEGKIVKAGENEGSWEDGWEYHVGAEMAVQFLPNENQFDVTKPSSKIQNTTYTFYRLNYSEEVRSALHMNPAYSKNTEKNPTEDKDEDKKIIAKANTEDPNDPNYYSNIPGVYRLSDLRIWVEDNGDYSDDTLGGSGIDADTNFDKALYVNLPVNMLPLRTVVVTPELDQNGDYTYKYTTNLDPDAVGYNASFPLRVFYTVGVEESVLAADRSVNVAGGISKEYLNGNKVDTDAEARVDGRNLAMGSLEFFSSWYNPLKRYSAYAINNNDYTCGAAVVSFSPDTDNRYYVFEKTLPVYGKAFVFTGVEWKPVVITQGSVPDNTKEFTFNPATFGGKVLASDLDMMEKGNPDKNYSSENISSGDISDALSDALGANVKAEKGDIVLLKNSLITDTRNVDRDDGMSLSENQPNSKDFTADDYYYLALEYFELDTNGNDANKVQYVVTRKGGEFGSAYEAAGLSNGELLCWYDANGKYSQIYPYLSATETGVRDRGWSYIGYKNIYDSDGRLIPIETLEAGAEQSAANGIRTDEDSNWVVASKIGGLRVGDLAQAVQYKESKEDKEDKVTPYNDNYVKQRYPEHENLTWRYYDNNLTRTANNYYMPTISAVTYPGTADAAGATAVVNTYLGNNGRLWMSSPSVSLTKTVVTGDIEDEKQADIDGREFNYQVFIQDFTGEKSAIVLRYNDKTNSWLSQLSLISMDPFLQAKDGQKVQVDKDGVSCYVYIGTNPAQEVNTGALVNVYQNRGSIDKDDEYIVDDGKFKVEYYDKTGKVVNEDDLKDVDVDNYNGKRKFIAGKVTLVPVDQYDAFISQADPVADLSTQDNFELLTLEPDDAEHPTDMVINSSYRTVSSYWTKTLNFGSVAEGNIYDKNMIAANTAETTLKNGYGLLFTGMKAGAEYRFAEKLTDDDIDRGYSLDHIDHVVEKGPTKSYNLNTSNEDMNKMGTANFQKADHVYSVFGTVDGVFEESGHYYNLWNADKTETEINGLPVTPSEKDSNTYPSVKVGDKITYEIKWANNTGQDAKVVIIDPLDNGVDFVEAVSDDVNKIKGAFCKTAADATKAAGAPVTTERTVVWNLGTQKADAHGTVTLTVEVNENAPKYWDYDQDGTPDAPVEDDLMVRNRATVRVVNHEYNTNTVVNPVGRPSKTETAVDHSAQAPDGAGQHLDVEKDKNLIPKEDGKLHGPLVYVGDKITYEIEWQNYKNEEAKVTVRDPLDSNVKFSSASNEGKYDPDKHEVVWELGKQPAREVGKVTLTVEVLDSATPVGYVDNTAYVQINNEPEFETETIENPVPHEEKTEVTPGDGVMIPVGDEITYKINWHNYHEDEAEVIIMDTLDPGVDYVGASDDGVYHKDPGDKIPASADHGGAIDIPAHTVVWMLGKQPANEEGTVTLTVKVNKNAKVEYDYNDDADGLTQGGGEDYEVLNQARVKVGNDSFIKTQVVNNPIPEKTETDVDHADNTLDPETVVLEPKEGEENTYVGPLVFVDDIITYQIHWTNGHAKPANVVVTDKLDPGVDFKDAYLDGDTGTKGIYDAKTHTVTWILKDQAAHADGVVVLEVKVNERATEVGFVENQAQVEVGTDPAVKTEVIENPTPKEEKEEISPGEGMQVMIGDEIEYAVRWHNYHTDQSADVVITDKLDPGVDFLFASLAGVEEPETESLDEPEEGTDAAGSVESDKEHADEGLSQKDSETQPEDPTGENDVTGAEGSDEENPSNEPAGENDVTGAEGSDEENPSNEPAGKTDASGSEKPDKENPSEAEPQELDDEKTKFVTPETENHSVTYEDEYGEITIEYNPDTHTVKWTLKNRPADLTGDVKLKVLVNENAEKLWNYDDPNLSDTTNDDRVLNQAGVKVGNDPEVKTRIIENPTKPVKTETEINDADVSREIEAGDDGYVGPEVYVGDLITYKITWQNNASDDEGKPVPAAVTITDGLDKGVDFVSASNGGAYDSKTHTVIWAFGEQGARARGYVTLTVRVNKNAVEPGKVENQATVQVGNNPQQTDKITNPVKEDGKLTVSKNVAGNLADTEKYWHFRVELDDKGISGRYGDMLFIDGVSEFTLKHGESKTASGLPAGTGYEVKEEEANKDDYVTTAEGDTGKIPKGDTASAVFLNRKGETPPPEAGYGNLQVKKTVTGAAGDKNKEWHFRVELSNAGINGWYGGMSFTNGVAEFTLRHGESRTAERLPKGVTYEVTEREANTDGYKTSSTGEKGTIVSGQSVAVSFVNYKESATPKKPQVGGTPKTGDNSRMAMWVVSMAVSLIGVLVSGSSLYQRRRRVRRRNIRRR